jgi:hypothetical protein
MLGVLANDRRSDRVDGTFVTALAIGAAASMTAVRVAGTRGVARAERVVPRRGFA